VSIHNNPYVQLAVENLFAAVDYAEMLPMSAVVDDGFALRVMYVPLLSEAMIPYLLFCHRSLDVEIRFCV